MGARRVVILGAVVVGLRRRLGCASDGEDGRLVQGMLGHANISTTERYLRNTDLGRMRQAMEGRTYAA